MSKLTDNITILARDPKVWVFVIALFSTNGMQAYLNMPVKSAPIKKVIKNKVTENNKIILKIVTINCNGKKQVTEHVIEHHGGK